MKVARTVRTLRRAKADKLSREKTVHVYASSSVLK